MKILEKTFPLRISDCDFRNAWRPGAILTELQEIAGSHSAALGAGREDLLQAGLAWVVARLELRMNRFPASGETITLKTFPRPHRHRFFPRYFMISDVSGKVIGLASSLWLLMDLETRQSVSADRLPHSLPDNSDLQEPISLPGNIPLLSAPERIFPWEAVYTDLDPNGHVNNTKYLDWLCNVLGVDCMAGHQLSSLIIHYNSEIRPGQPLSLHLRREENQVQLIGIHEDRTAFEIGAVLVPRP